MRSASASIIGATSPISAPEVVLAAIAGRTSRILLGSAVTVLSTDDPVRVFERFSTLDALSNGRAEVILGRGSFTESYPLFGYDMHATRSSSRTSCGSSRSCSSRGPSRGTARRDRLCGRDDLSADRKRPIADVGRRRRQPRIRRPRGALRPPAHARDHRRPTAALPPVRRALPAGAPETRAAGAAGGRPLAGARRRNRRAGEERTLAALRGDDEPHRRRARMAARRPRAQFDAEAGPDGALCVGSPETVAAKIAGTVRRSGFRGSTSSTASARCRTMR